MISPCCVCLSVYVSPPPDNFRTPVPTLMKFGMCKWCHLVLVRTHFNSDNRQTPKDITEI
jgi:hypothetical protein